MRQATGLVESGSFVRRRKDGMVGRAGRSHAMAHSHGIAYDQDILWIGEWTYGTWVPGRRGAAAMDILEGPEADEARARFARLECPACGGTGAKDRRLAPGGYNACPEERCRLGRLAGVEPAFDASYADYTRFLEASAARDAATRSARRSSGTGPGGGQAAWRDATLKYAGLCAECGAPLAVGTPAQMRKDGGRWTVRCAAHSPD